MIRRWQSMDLLANPSWRPETAKAHQQIEAAWRFACLMTARFDSGDRMGQSFDSAIPGFTQPVSDWADGLVAHERVHIHIDERTAATKWRGESMDFF
ncbi:MAG TPA: hypothetical protein VFS24_16960 [Steroidobacteraceae bacterium]|nr:hypothetical protein [Steroidobacteraceae bacterium]